MASIEDQIKALREAKEFLRKETPKRAKQVAANDLIALIVNRVVQRGESSDGSKFTPYSTNPVAAFRFVGKSRRNSADKKVRAKVKAKTALSYKEFREMNGLKSDKKNFEFTNEMWRKFGIITFVANNGNFKIEIAGTTASSQKKIEENSKRENKSIIAASAKEVNIIRSIMADWIQIELKKIVEL